MAAAAWAVERDLRGACRDMTVVGGRGRRVGAVLYSVERSAARRRGWSCRQRGGAAREGNWLAPVRRRLPQVTCRLWLLCKTDSVQYQVPNLGVGRLGARRCEEEAQNHGYQKDPKRTRQRGEGKGRRESAGRKKHMQGQRRTDLALPTGPRRSERSTEVSTKRSRIACTHLTWPVQRMYCVLRYLLFRCSSSLQGEAPGGSCSSCMISSSLPAEFLCSTILTCCSC